MRLHVQKINLDLNHVIERDGIRVYVCRSMVHMVSTWSVDRGVDNRSVGVRSVLAWSARRRPDVGPTTPVPTYRSVDASTDL